MMREHPTESKDEEGQGDLRPFFVAAILVAIVCGVMVVSMDSEDIQAPQQTGTDGKVVLEELSSENLVSKDLDEDSDAASSEPVEIAVVAPPPLPSLVVEMEPEIAKKGPFRRWTAREIRPAPEREEVIGFRGNGRGEFVWESPIREWSKSKNVRWVTPMPEWSNSSPIVVKGRVFTTVEPLSLKCLDLETGRPLWVGKGDVSSTLKAEDVAKLSDLVSNAEKLADELEAKQRTLYRLKRKLRKQSGDPSLVAKMEVMEEEVNELRERMAEVDRFREPVPLEFIGYAASTPVSDGDSVYALFGNGVATRFDLDGNRQWSTWLGDPVRPMNGNDRGHASSPLLRGGVLVLAYGRILALDAASGALIWRSEDTFRDFGTAALMKLGKKDVVVSPDGEIFDLQSGELLHKAVDDLFFVGPHVQGNRALFMGASSLAESNRQESSEGRAFEFSLDDSGNVSSQRLWESPLGNRFFFTSPVVFKERVFHISGDGVLKSFKVSDGSLSFEKDLAETMEEPLDLYSSPVLVNGLLYLTSELGTTLVYDIEAGKVIAENRLEEKTRASLLFHEGDFFVRTFDNLYRFGKD